MDGDRCPVEQLVYKAKDDEPRPGRYLCDVHRQARFSPERLVIESTDQRAIIKHHNQCGCDFYPDCPAGKAIVTALSLSEATK